MFGDETLKKTITEISPKETKSKKGIAKSKLNVAAYCRVSTESDEQMNSLANQKEYFEKLYPAYKTKWTTYLSKIN